MPIDDLTALGDALRAARKQKNLTQEQLADESHVSTKQIADIEKARRNPSSIAAYSTSIHISCLAFFELMKYNERNCRRYEHGLHDTQRGKRKMGRFVPSSQLLLRRGAYSRRCENGRCLAAS